MDILIFSKDWRFGAFLKALLEEKGIDAEHVTNLETLKVVLRKFTPKVIVVECKDFTDEELEWTELVAGNITTLAVCGWGDRVPKNSKIIRKPVTYSEIADEVLSALKGSD